MDGFGVYAVNAVFGAVLGQAMRTAVAPHMTRPQRSHSLGVLYIRTREHMFRILGDATMAKQLKSGQERDFSGFVNINLDEQHKNAMLTDDGPDMETLWNWIAALTYQGYKFSFTWDTYSQAQQVAMFCWGQASDPNYSYALSARHPDLPWAIYSLWFKHERVAAGNWLSVAKQPTPQNWG